MSRAALQIVHDTRAHPPPAPIPNHVPVAGTLPSDACAATPPTHTIDSTAAHPRARMIVPGFLDVHRVGATAPGEE
jgi:hypothetical protein